MRSAPFELLTMGTLHTSHPEHPNAWHENLGNALGVLCLTMRIDC
jgi:hypothetical protein